MPIAHEHARQALSLLLKKVKFSPIISIQGPRQCGKSYLASKLLPKKLSSTEFKTLDARENRKLADHNPRIFLQSTTEKHLIIDEVQKSPDLFDEMKTLVDEKRRPGQFIILGSTEFSIESKIKESLTGRLSKIKIFPFNLSETRNLELNPIKNYPFIGNKPRVSRSEVLKYLLNGGLPGLFIIKSELEKSHALRDWIDLTVSRDIFQFKNKKLDSQIAEQILHSIATIEEPSAISIANAIGKSTTTTLKHILALKNLFVIDEIKPFSKSSGKPVFYLCDVGILNYYNATLDKKILTWLLLELKSQLSYKGELSDKIFYFKSARSKPLHFIYQNNNKLTAMKILSADSFDQRDLLIFDSLKKKFPKLNYDFHVLYGGNKQIKNEDILISPWEFIV